MRTIAKGMGLLGAAVVGLATITPNPALAWGNDGHKAIALIARKYLAEHNPAALMRVEAVLASDNNTLTAKDIASRATWADVFRESSTANKKATRQWHFVDINFADDPSHPSLTAPCFNWPGLAPGQVASKGDADDCIVDKIEQFHTEIASSTVSSYERRLALKFLLHFVGDIHQPLHAAEREHDAGGNNIGVRLPGWTTATRLHSYWDTQAVRDIGSSAQTIADDLYPEITMTEAAAWRSGSAKDWAKESFAVAKASAYDLPANAAGTFVPPYAENPIPFYQTSDAYAGQAKAAAREQLKRAGVRLAWYLEDLVT